jgi:hypothetical protein
VADGKATDSACELDLEDWEQGLEDWMALAEGALSADPVLADQKQECLWYLVSLRMLDGRLREQVVGAWFGIAPGARRKLHTLDRGLPEFPDYSPEILSGVFEKRAHGAAVAPKRRDQGAYFTPFWLSELVVQETLAPLIEGCKGAEEVLALTVCDPAAGAGAFALPALELLARSVAEREGEGTSLSHSRSRVLESCLNFVDSDALSVAFLRVLLASRLDANDVDVAVLERKVVCGDSVLGAVAGHPLPSLWSEHFRPVMAKGGFSAIVGNPPWGTIKPSVREHFGAIDASLLQLQGQDLKEAVREHFSGEYDEWANAASVKRRYSRALRDVSGYILQGPGDSEFYRFFVERAISLLLPEGRLGFIVPSGLRTAEGAVPLRRALLEQGTVELLLDFINTRRIFDIHTMFRFLVLIWAPGKRTGVKRAHFSLTSQTDVEECLRRPQSGLVFSKAFLSATSPERFAVPAASSRRDVRLLRRLHDKHPALGEHLADAWNVSFAREVDMTNDSHLFVPSTPALMSRSAALGDGSILNKDLGRLLPVYEGRMVHQFDAAAKAYVSGHGRSAKWKPLPFGEKPIAPHFYVPESSLPPGKAPTGDRAGFCDISGHANERTALAALIPGVGVCGNKVPTCRFDQGGAELHLIWLAISNSFVIDWILRRRVGTSLNFFQWYQVPFPRLSPAEPLGRELVELTKTVNAATRSGSSDAQRRRARARARIDALVLTLFGLDISDAIDILEDFPLIDRSAPGRFATMTRDHILLECMKEMGQSDGRLSDLGIKSKSGPDSLRERILLAEAESAWAYVPKELRLPHPGLSGEPTPCPG